MSHHLRSLTESGLLVSRRDGKEVYYRAADTGQIRLLHEIVEQVMEIACPERALDYGASQEEIIRHVHDDLTQNLSERVTIEELARKYLMNTTTLKRVFKQVYGETIAAHIKKHRMEAAGAAAQDAGRCCRHRAGGRLREPEPLFGSVQGDLRRAADRIPQAADVSAAASGWSI